MLRKACIGFVIVLLIMVMVSCGGNDESLGDESEDASSVDVTSDSNEMTIKDDASETKVTQDMDESLDIPEDYPEDVLPVYPELFIITAMKREDGSFAISGVTKDDMASVIEFYEKALEKANVLMKNKTDMDYSNIGDYMGSTYTVNIAKDGEEFKEGFETNVMIILVPGEINTMGETEAEASTEESSTGMNKVSGDLTFKSGIQMPEGYPEKVLPLYMSGNKTQVAATGEQMGQNMLGYMTTDPIEKVYAYYEEYFDKADNFMMMNNTVTDKVFTLTIDGYNFQVVLHTNDENTGEDLAYKTLISILY